MLGLSYGTRTFSRACGILVPGQGIESMCLALESRSLTTGPPGMSHPTTSLPEVRNPNNPEEECWGGGPVSLVSMRIWGHLKNTKPKQKKQNKTKKNYIQKYSVMISTYASSLATSEAHLSKQGLLMSPVLKYLIWSAKDLRILAVCERKFMWTNSQNN